MCFGCGVLLIVVWVCGGRLATLILDLLLGWCGFVCVVSLLFALDYRLIVSCLIWCGSDGFVGCLIQ